MFRYIPFFYLSKRRLAMKSKYDEFYRFSTVTGKSYDVFKTVKILNILQVASYMDNDVFPVDIRVSQDENKRRCLVFYFDREESKDVYDKWCKHEL